MLDGSTKGNKVTFSRTFHKAWFDGYDSAMKEMDENPKVKKWRVALSGVMGKERRAMVAIMLENQGRGLERLKKDSPDDGRLLITDVIKKSLRGGK